MSTINTRFYPYQDISQHEVLSLYSLLTSGLAGTLVKAVTGSANPQYSDGYSSTPVGGNYNSPGVYLFSNKYETKWRVQPTASGDTRYNALGLTQLSTLYTDPNGLPLNLFPARAKELGVVTSGETVPVITRGTVAIWGQYIDQSLGSVQPGNVAVVSRSGNGLLAAVDPTNATVFSSSGASALGSQLYTPASVVGKWLSSLPNSNNTGLASEFSAQGGFAFLELNVR